MSLRASWRGNRVRNVIPSLSRDLTKFIRGGIRSFASLRTELCVGFSLIEVLLTMAFLSFLLAGTAELALHSVRSKAVTDGYFRRTGILTAKLEGLKALTFDGDGLRAGEYREDIDSSPPEPAALAEWRIDDRGSGAKWIDFRITLPGRPGRNLRAVLVVSKFLGF